MTPLEGRVKLLELQLAVLAELLNTTVKAINAKVEQRVCDPPRPKQ